MSDNIDMQNVTTVIVYNVLIKHMVFCCTLLFFGNIWQFYGVKAPGNAEK